jgi:adenylate cyclase
VGAKLTITPPAAPAFEVELGNTTTIGRTRDNTVSLSFCPLASRQHALIRCQSGEQYQLVDLGSRNGTLVNDQRVIMPVNLTDGAVIRIADAVLVFSRSDAPHDERFEMTMVGTTAFKIPEALPAALLVCDIRGFSTMSEKIPSQDLAPILGSWFREAGNLVTGQGGTIDKFIGDALLAYWGHAGQDAANCQAALDTGRGMVALAAARVWPDGSPFRIVVALHHGKVTCGNVGLTAERDATIIGDAVNTVFRLEGTAKEINRPLICSGEFHAHIDGQAPFQDFGPQTLKGKGQTVKVFGLEEP